MLCLCEQCRIRLDEDGNYLVASMISLLVGQGRTTKDTAAQSVKNSLAAIFESVGAPLRYVKFLSPGEEGAQPYQVDLSCVLTCPSFLEYGLYCACIMDT